MSYIWVANFAGGFTPDDVAFYAGDITGSPIFTLDDQRALTGNAVYDLTTFEGLPSVGTIGNVYFNNPDQNQIIGQWRITAVPEPAAGIMLSSIFSLLVLRRRR